jgi:hypothetical protein
MKNSSRSPQWINSIRSALDEGNYRTITVKRCLMAVGLATAASFSAVAGIVALMRFIWGPLS